MFKKIVVWNVMLLSLYATDIVVDTQTNLAWYDSEDPYIVNWRHADSYCSELEVEGYADWRLPSEEELVALAKDEALKKRFMNLWEQVFWTNDNGIFNATTVYSGNGFVSSTDNCEKFATICVRKTN
jgi:hypothetical protein